MSLGTIEKAKAAKSLAEQRILVILNDLKKETEMDIYYVDLNIESIRGMGKEKPSHIITNVNIDLRLG